MEELKQLHKLSRSILPSLRNFQIRDAKNLLTDSEKENFIKIEQSYKETLKCISEKEQVLILEKFGNESLQEWNDMKSIENTQFTTASEIGQRFVTLQTKLIPITEFLEKLRTGLG